MNNPTNVLTKLTELIDKNKTYIIDGSLNRNLLAADARKYDVELLNLLQQDAELKEHFFAETDGGLVFKKDVFLQFIMNKEFLPDSYTKYKIKIGLGAEDGSLLSENGDVVLNWPYKDAILEGGQDKEDQKRSEVFFNEVLAPDQITRLLDDKVFTNWKRYDKDGEHELDELKDDDNLIIKGNNLVVLHSLKKRYAGKVKLIYIDPPYNTGNDSFGYNDRFNHSTWLTFMRNRLTVARELLRSDGVIFVQCDDNEQAYLKVMLDEIFGRESFVTTIHCQMSTTQGMKVKVAQNGNIVKNAEYIIVFSKDGHKDVAKNPLYDLRPDYDEHYSLYLKKDGTIGSLRELYDYRFPKDLNNKKPLSLKEAYKKSDEFAEIVRTHLAEIVRNDKVTGFSISEGLESGKYREIERAGKKYLLTLDSKDKVCQLLRLSDSWGKTDGYGGEEGLRKIRGDWWEGFYLDMGNVAKEGTSNFKNGKKPERLIEQIIRMSTDIEDIVLDYHLGSGTTAAVAHKMGRQYIGIEQLYYGENDPTVRLQNVINGDKTGISKSVDWQGGGSFVYANIMNNSNKFRKRVESAKSDKDYMELLKEAMDSSFLSYRVDPKKLNEDDFRKLSAAEKRRLLLELIDNNTLYVNYEDINDPSFKVSDKDKEFNKKLYEKK